MCLVLTNNIHAEDKKLLKNITLDGRGKKIDYDSSKTNEDNITFFIDFINKGNAKVQSLFSISNPNYNDAYFSIFIRDNGTVGVEIRNRDNFLLERPATIYNKIKGVFADNKIAININKKEKSIKIFANGYLMQKFNDYRDLNVIENLSTAMLGGVFRNNKTDMGFTGIINEFSILTNLSGDEICKITQDDSKHIIFSNKDNLKSNYYRIPTLITINNGTLLSSIDARKGGTHDARSNIDIAVAISNDNGNSWENISYALHFDDYKDEILWWPRDNKGKNLQIGGSASFIDSVLLQEENTGRIYLFADAMPYGIGFNNAVRNSGFKKVGNDVFLKLKKEGEKSFNYTIRENGRIYNDLLNTPTEYKVDKKWNLYRNNEPLKCDQYKVIVDGNTINEVKTDVKVNQNIFYKDSEFKVERTNFLVYTYSDDNGYTWEDFKIFKPFGNINDSVPLYGPGRGLQLKNGIHKGRLILSMYSSRTGEFGYIYSDDYGVNWNYIRSDLGKEGATAEAQTIEFSNGDLMTFYRTSIGKVGYVLSNDGGITWSNPQYLENINVAKYGTQLSVIKYSKLIDGKELVLLSMPIDSNGRKKGVIKLGLSSKDDTNHKIKWIKDYSIDDDKYGFSYSCLTELQNGDIGLHYEKWDSWSRNELHLANGLVFEKFTINELMK